MQEALAKKPNGTETASLILSKPPQVSPKWLETAMSRPDLNIEQLKELLNFQRELMKDQAQSSFVEAMTRFKAETIVITRDKFNKQYGSKYVSLGNLVNTVTPFLSKHSLSVSWDVDQSSGIKVTCIIQHAFGHKESVSMIVPPDKSGSKNPIQEIKSAITYAKACTFESICGLASSDANIDDDGNGSAPAERVDEEIFVQRMDAIKGANNHAELKRIYMAACEEAGDDLDTKKAYGAAKNKRYRELANVNG